MSEVQRKVRCPKCKHFLTFTFQLPKARPPAGAAKGVAKTGGGMALVGLLAEVGVWPDVLMGPIALGVAYFFASQLAYVLMPFLNTIFGNGENE